MISGAINNLSHLPATQRGWWVRQAGLPATLANRLWAAIGGAQLTSEQVAAGVRAVMRSTEEQEELAQLENALLTLGGKHRGGNA